MEGLTATQLVHPDSTKQNLSWCDFHVTQLYRLRFFSSDIFTIYTITFSLKQSQKTFNILYFVLLNDSGT